MQEQDTIQAALQTWLEQQQTFWNDLSQQSQSAAPDWQSFIQQHPLHNANPELQQLLQENQQLGAAAAKLFQDFISKQQTDPAADHTQLSRQLQALLEEHAASLFARNWQLSGLLTPQNESLQAWQQALDDFAQQLTDQLKQLPAFQQQPAALFQKEIRQQIQQQTEKLREASQECSKAFAELSDTCRKISQQASQLLEEKLSAAADLNSIRELQDLWIDCYEKAYASEVFTGQYQHQHANFNNSLLQLQKLFQDSIHQQLSNTPLNSVFVSRQDYDQSLKQQHQLRKQVRRQQQTIDALEQRLQLLEARLQQKPQQPE